MRDEQGRIQVGSLRYHWVRDAQGRRSQKMIFVPGADTLLQWLEDWVLGAEPMSVA